MDDQTLSEDEPQIGQTPEPRVYTDAELIEACRLVSVRVSRDYSAVEVEDLQQELSLEAWRSRDKIEDMQKWLWTAARGIATDLHEKVMRCKGYSQYEYTSPMVRRVLEYSFSYQNWETIPLPDSARSAPRGARVQWDQDAQADLYQQVNDPTDARDIAADVQRALEMVSFQDRQRLIARYKYGIKPTPGAETTALSRAVCRVRDKLNSYRGLTEAARMSGRRAMGNAAALSKIQGLT